MENVIDNPRPMFENKDGVKFRFIDFITPDKMKVWEIEGTDYMGMMVESCKFIGVIGIDKDILIGLGVWDKITKETQEKVEKRAVIDLEDKRRGRKTSEEMREVPEELICKLCHTHFPCTKGSIVQRAKTKNLDIKDYLENYVCQTCVPSKGRHKKTDPNMPTENPTLENNDDGDEIPLDNSLDSL